MCSKINRINLTFTFTNIRSIVKNILSDEMTLKIVNYVCQKRQF